MANRVNREHRLARESALRLFVGKRIGRGHSRHVYELNMDSTRVLKVEHTGYTWGNIAEWRTWEAVKETPLEDWFAPCFDIDSEGNALTQARVEVFASEADFKKAINETRGGVLPAFFDDVHYGNFGWLEGRVVCHDYGFTNFMSEAVKFNWRNLAGESVIDGRTTETRLEAA